MPYASKAQQRYFHAAEARGQMPPKVVHEFDEATKKQKGGFSKLPNRLPEHNDNRAAQKEDELRKHLAARDKARKPKVDATESDVPTRQPSDDAGDQSEARNAQVEDAEGV